MKNKNAILDKEIEGFKDEVYRVLKDNNNITNINIPDRIFNLYYKPYRLYIMDFDSAALDMACAYTNDFDSPPLQIEPL